MMTGSQSPSPTRSDSGLLKVVGPYQLLALGLGSILGSAWLVMLGIWLEAAGPVGTMIAFGAGAVMMGVVAACYAELTARIPKTGAEFTFVSAIFGPHIGFVVGWFLTLNLVAIASFEAIAFYLMVQQLVPGIAGTKLYSSFGESIGLGQLLLSVVLSVAITAINYRGVKTAAIFQSVVTYGFIIVVITVVGFGLGHGHMDNLKPLFNPSPANHPWTSIVWVFSTTTLFLNGFQAIPQAVEERSAGVSLRVVGNLTVAAVLIAAAFMCLIVFASSVASPWLALRGDPLAPAAAVRSLLPHGILATILLIAGAASVLKTWNVVVLMAARTLLAQSQAGVIPKWFSFVHPRFGSPTNALIFVAATSMIGVFAGRGALGPVVNMSSMCLGAASSLCCAGLIILRKRNTGSTAPPYRVLGGLPVIALASVGTLGMTAMTMIHSAQESVRTIPVEWVLLIIWAGVGTLFRAWTRSKRGRESPFAPP